MTSIKFSNRFQVLTPKGFVDFKGIKQKQFPYLIKFTFDDHSSIKVTPEHKFIVRGNEIEANSLKILDVLESNSGLVKIVNIEREIDEEKQFYVYDLYNVNNENNSYYTNNIISHNCCDFILSGETIIDPEQIQWIKDNTMKPPIAKEGPNKEFWIWRYREDAKNYIVSADVAKGNEGDYSTIQVICIETFEQVAEFKSNKIDAERFGEILCKIGIDYNNALLVPENNNFGQRTIQKIIDLHYTNLFYYDKKFKGLIFPDFRETLKESQKEPGWPTGTKTRTMVLENLIGLIRESVNQGKMGNPGYLLIHSSRFCEELGSWEIIDGRFDHRKNQNDDLIMAMAIGAFIKSVYNRLTEGERKSAIEFMKFFSNDKKTVDMNFGIQAPKSVFRSDMIYNGEDLSNLLKD